MASITWWRRSNVADVAASPIERIAVAFSRILRGVGIDVVPARTMGFVAALEQIDITRRDHVYWAGLATLTSDPRDRKTYDAAFRVFWERFEPLERPADAPEETIEFLLATDAGPDDVPDDADGEVHEGPIIEVRWSDREVLATKDFADCSDAELEQIQNMMRDLRWSVSTKTSRRLARSKRKTRRPDLARTVRRALATGGEPIRRDFRRPDRRPRRLILLVDVSGSMEAYARALLRFAHAAVVGRTRVEAFTIGTRLTRVTRELQSRDPDAAMRAASDSVKDWSGGTRLGETLRSFNDEWGVRGLARGAVVVILSDGWDRGDAAELGAQMQRLHRVTHDLVWVNPLKYTPGYAPLAQGMAAALPHADQFVEGHAFESIEALARLIGQQS